MREQPFVNPTITLLQFFWSHVPGLEDGMTCVVECPILVQQSSLGFHLPEQWRRRIRSENVKSRTLQAVLFNPLRGTRKNIFTIMVKTQYERAIHLDAAIVQHAHPAGIV